MLMPAETAAPDETLSLLRDLGVAREALVKDRTAAKNRQKAQAHPLLKRQTVARLKQIADQLKAIEAEILVVIRRNPEVSRRLDILASIPGLGLITAFAMLIGMPELGHLGPKQAAALASPPSPGSPDSGAARQEYRAAEPISERPSTCLL